MAAPKGLRLTKIERAVSEKADWILQQQESFRQLQRGFPRQFVSGESYYYMGRQYRLKVRRSRARNAVAEIRLYGGCFEVVVPSWVSPEERSDVVKRQLLGWYRCRAQEMLPEIIRRCCQSLSLEQPTVSIRHMSKRWGSCNGDNRIIINWRILMAPRRLTEYVVAHELVHLIHHDHSRAFWRLLERIMPDYETRRQELAIHGAKYQL